MDGASTAARGRRMRRAPTTGAGTAGATATADGQLERLVVVIRVAGAAGMSKPESRSRATRPSVAHVGGRLIPRVPVLVDRARDQAFERGGTLAFSSIGAGGSRLRMASNTTAVVCALERLLAGGHLVEHEPEREQVASRTSSSSPRACSGDM